MNELGPKDFREFITLVSYFLLTQFISIGISAAKSLIGMFQKKEVHNEYALERNTKALIQLETKLEIMMKQIDIIPQMQNTLVDLAARVKHLEEKI